MIGADPIRSVLAGQELAVVAVVERAYLAHADGAAVDPPSTILRFPDRPDNRIIALPASLAAEFAVDGIKWIASVPGNPDRGLPRALGVVILNDQVSGFPYACLEASLISAARTAASAVLAARHLCRHRPRPTSVSYIGCGLIAEHVHRYLSATGWRFDQVDLYDRSPTRAAGFERSLVGARPAGRVRVRTHASAGAAVAAAELVVFATTATRPHVSDPACLRHAPVVLHLSLRDLAPRLLLEAENVVDDVEHCLREQTSAQLTERLSGGRNFITATLADLLLGRASLDPARPVVFSPFGLGILDLAVGQLVYQRVRAAGAAVEVADFYRGVGVPPNPVPS